MVDVDFSPPTTSSSSDLQPSFHTHHACLLCCVGNWCWHRHRFVCTLPKSLIWRHVVAALTSERRRGRQFRAQEGAECRHSGLCWHHHDKNASVHPAFLQLVESDPALFMPAHLALSPSRSFREIAPARRQLHRCCASPSHPNPKKRSFESYKCH